MTEQAMPLAIFFDRRSLTCGFGGGHLSLLRAFDTKGAKHKHPSMSSKRKGEVSIKTIGFCGNFY